MVLKSGSYDGPRQTLASLELIIFESQSGMKRRGGGGASSASGPSGGTARSTVAEADVDDRELSAAAKVRAQQKAVREAGGGGLSQPTESLPIGLIVGAVALIGLMVYLTVKFS